jgi:hypothetical protein
LPPSPDRVNKKITNSELDTLMNVVFRLLDSDKTRTFGQ